MKRIWCLMICMCFLLGGCAGEQEAATTLYAMNTVMELRVWGAEPQEALTQITGVINDMEATWSATDPDSVLSALNEGQTPDGEYLALLERVQALSQRTDGAFDPKLGGVSAAWGFYNEAYRVPTDAEIGDGLNVEQWDLGAALKGYTGDRCVAVLEQLDVDRAILNLGGNIQTYGQKTDGSPWNIGIQDPDGGDPVGTVAVTGTAAIVTSGDYQRYFEADGVRYHHILDPKTGRPADSGLRSVTVICRDGMTADALSTALFVMGLERGSDLWRDSDDFEAVFITTDGTVYATEGAALSGCEYEVITR